MPRSSMFVSCIEHVRKQEHKTCSVYILMARVQEKIKRYRGGGRKGDGLRCEGGGGSWETTKKYRWPTIVTKKSFDKNNNNSNLLNTTKN